MKRIIAYMLASSFAAAVPVMAQAQPSNQSHSINDQQAALYARIDAGVRDRSLTAAEANRLRAQYQDIARLERQYRVVDASDQAERAISMRFDSCRADPV